MARKLMLYADDILEALSHIEEDIAGHDFAAFQEDRRARQLVERNLEIVSEASRHLPGNLKEKEAGIDWKGIANIGNVLRHEYHASRAEILWEVCRRDLKPLRAAIRRIRRDLARTTNA